MLTLGCGAGVWGKSGVEQGEGVGVWSGVDGGLGRRRSRERERGRTPLTGEREREEGRGGGGGGRRGGDKLWLRPLYTANETGAAVAMVLVGTVIAVVMALVGMVTAVVMASVGMVIAVVVALVGTVIAVVMVLVGAATILLDEHGLSAIHIPGCPPASVSVDGS